MLMILKNVDNDSLPLKITSDFTISNNENENNILNEYELQNNKIKTILQYLCRNANYESDEKKLLINGQMDLIKNHLSKLGSFKLSQLDNFSSNDTENIERVANFFYDLYKEMLKFTLFDERLFLYNFKGDKSPRKKIPYKHDQFAKNLENNSINLQKPSVCRSLNFENLLQKCGENENSPQIINSNNPFNMNQSPKILINKSPNINTVTNSKQFMNYQRPIPSNTGLNFNKPQLFQNNISPSPVLGSNLDYLNFTPCTRVIQMDSWVKNYSTNWNKENLNSYFPNENLKEIFYKILNSVMNQMFKKIDGYHIKILTERQVITNLTLKIMYLMIVREEKRFYKEIACYLLENELFIKSVFTIALEIILYIENSEELNVFEILEYIGLNLLDFLKIINPFNKLDVLIPNAIKYHFSSLEVQILSNYIWKNKINFKQLMTDYFKNANDTNLNEAIDNLEFNNQSLFVFHPKSVFEDQIKFLTENTQKINAKELLDKIKKYYEYDSMNIYLRRITNYCIHLNKDICGLIGISHETAKQIEDKLKTLLHHHINLFTDKHLDQIIVCTIYITQLIKKEKVVDKLFNHIINCYHKVKCEDTQESFKNIFSKVKHQNQVYDIIGFYNNVFVPLFNEHFTQNDDEKVTKRRKTSNCDEIGHLHKKLKFEEDSAFSISHVIYDSIKSTVTINNTLLNTPIKTMNSVNNTPINKTPRTLGLRNLDLPFGNTENLLIDMKVSPKKQSSYKFNILERKSSQAKGHALTIEKEIFKDKVKEKEEDLRGLSVNLFKTNSFITKDDENNIVNPLDNLLSSNKKEKDNNSEKATPEFAKYK